jgi:NADH:ubiquinone oxidoreductase subunit K
VIVWFSAALFSLGMYGVLTRRDLVGVIACVEVMLTGVTVFLVAATSASSPLLGQVTTLAILALAACEAVIGIALVLASVRRTGRERLDEMDEVSG